MRVGTGTEYSLNNCCGIQEIGEFYKDNGVPYWRSNYNTPKIKDISDPGGCGIFVSTFLPSQQKAMDECEKYHTLLFKTGPHLNLGPDASEEGKEEGVYLCVFKYGKGK